MACCTHCNRATHRCRRGQLNLHLHRRHLGVRVQTGSEAVALVLQEPPHCAQAERQAERQQAWLAWASVVEGHHHRRQALSFCTVMVQRWFSDGAVMVQ